MPEPDHATTLHQVLADPTGRRRRRLAIAGSIATAVLALWLAVLILGGLGLQPLAGIPIVGDLGGGGGVPPALPKRVQAGNAKRATVAPVPRTAREPVPTTGPIRSRRRSVTAPSPAKTLPRARRAPVTAPGRAKTTPGRGPASPAPSPTTASPTSTAPGQNRTPPGQTKTGHGPPTTTPGTTPRPKGNGAGHQKTVTTP
jgi:hypothetical protein